MSGFEVRNAASSGEGVKTACPTSADTPPVSLTTVRVAAAAAGPPAARLATGVHVAGYCGASLAGVTVDGAATGIAVDSAAPTVETTASSPRVTGSTVAAATVVEGKLTFAGGTVDGNAAGVLVGATGAGAPTFTATGTTFSGNTGDAVYVARGTLVSDGCPYVNNGTHVHAQPLGGAPVNVTVQNSSGAAKMTGATNSAFRLLAMGSGSTLVLSGNEVVGNNATQSYNVATGLTARRGTWCSRLRFLGPSSMHAESRLLGTSGPGSCGSQRRTRSTLAAVPACGQSRPTSFACYDAAGGRRRVLKRRECCRCLESLDPAARSLSALMSPELV